MDFDKLLRSKGQSMIAMVQRVRYAVTGYRWRGEVGRCDVGMQSQMSY